jgi:hypothetical protein
MTHFKVRKVLLIFCVFVLAEQSFSQASKPCSSPVSLSAWINCRVEQIAAAKINQRGTTKQVETPSIAENTTSLVEQSQSPDLFGIALNLAGLESKTTGEEKNTSGTITASTYAAFAAASKNDPLDPAFYQEHANLRRFSFTLGRELPDDKNTKTNNRATIVGFKYLIINKRDASLDRNKKQLAIIGQDLLPTATVDFLNTSKDIENYLYKELAPTLGLPIPATPATTISFLNVNLGPNLQATLNQLTEKQNKDVDEIIAKRITSKVNLIDASQKAIETIRRAPQLSFTVQSKLRSGNGTDVYRGGLTFDYGIYRRINLTLNATYDYQDNKVIGGDLRGGRIAGETFFQLTPEKNIFSGKDPWLFSIAGEGKWMSNTPSAYTGQLKLTIPVFDGVNFPISVSFANRKGLIKESTIRGRFGFTFDIAKLINGYRK